MEENRVHILFVIIMLIQPACFPLTVTRNVHEIYDIVGTTRKLRLWRQSKLWHFLGRAEASWFHEVWRKRMFHNQVVILKIIILNEGITMCLKINKYYTNVRQHNLFILE